MRFRPYSYETFCEAFNFFELNGRRHVNLRGLYEDFSAKSEPILDYFMRLVGNRGWVGGLRFRCVPITRKQFEFVFKLLLDRPASENDIFGSFRNAYRTRYSVLSGILSSVEYSKKNEEMRACEEECVDLEDKVLFIHIPKTAGMSIAKLLGTSAVQFYHETSGRFDIEKFSASKIVGGHWGMRKFCANGARFGGYLAVVRDPVERAISRFNYYREKYPKDNNLRCSSFDPHSMELTLQSGFSGELLDNLQCRMLCGEPSFEFCLEFLKDKNFILGHFDHMDVFSTHLIECYSLKGEMPRTNVASTKNYKRTFERDEELVRFLRARNSEDEKLSNYVRERQLIIHNQRGRSR